MVASQKRRIGTILIVVGLLGVGISLMAIACLTQQIALWAIGSIALLGDGAYLLKQYYL